jgi:hypothetical protein
VDDHHAYIGVVAGDVGFVVGKAFRCAQLVHPSHSKPLRQHEDTDIVASRDYVAMQREVFTYRRRVGLSF